MVFPEILCLKNDLIFVRREHGKPGDLKLHITAPAWTKCLWNGWKLYRMEEEVCGSGKPHRAFPRVLEFPPHTVPYCVLYETTPNNSWYDKHSENGSSVYYYFRGRCAFPIHNVPFYVEEGPQGE